MYVPTDVAFYDFLYNLNMFCITNTHGFFPLEIILNVVIAACFASGMHQTTPLLLL